MNYRELQNVAKGMGRTDSGNHQLVPSNVKHDALRANLERVLADRSNHNQPPASPSPTKPKPKPEAVRRVAMPSVAGLGAQLQLNPMAMMMGGPPRSIGGMRSMPTASSPQPPRKLEHPTLARARRSVRRSQAVRRRKSTAVNNCVRLVAEAIRDMKHRAGSSRAQIAAHIEAMHGIAPGEAELNVALRQPSFDHQNGCFKLTADYVKTRRPRGESLVDSMKAIVEEEADSQTRSVPSRTSSGLSLIERMKAATSSEPNCAEAAADADADIQAARIAKAEEQAEAARVEEERVAAEAEAEAARIA
eukprot:COSAG02_NODE_15448_length_1170_cov_1.503268_1_plen_304_part_01